MLPLRCLVVASLVAGCGRIGFDAAAGPAAADALPPDQDLDLDGVPNALDDCPTVANTDQHDEDHDARGDACDGCPHLADDAADADGDGVGDACDPSPTAANRIRAFLPFAGPAFPPGWAAAAQGTSWTVVGDDLAIQLVDANVGAITAATPAGSRVKVETELTIDAVNPLGSGSPGRNAAIVDHDVGAPGSEDTLMFGLHQDLNTSNPAEVVGFVLSAGAFSSEFLRVSTGAPIVPGTRYHLTYTRDASSRMVSAEPGTAGGATAAGTGGDLGVRVRGVTARIHYVIVIADP